jgi:hypothetical protein
MSPRTARPIFAVFAVGLVSLFFWSFPFSGPSSQYFRDVYDGWRSPEGRWVTLAERLQEEDVRYAATVEARQGLIKKFGPTKEKIQS